MESTQKLRRKRKRTYILLVTLLITAWYGLTGLESWQMGLNPLTRRPFTLFDSVLFGVIIIGFINLHWWYGKCPRCGKRMRGQLNKYCAHCQWGCEDN
jgi:hypothetical protein